MSDGIECKCAAYDESECSCGADWTPQEVYDLRQQLADLKAGQDFLVAEAYRCGLEVGIASGAASRDDEVYALKAELKSKHALSFRNQVAELEQQLAEREKQVVMLRDAVSYSKHQCEGLRVWGGMSWTYHPWQTKRIFEVCEKAMADTAPKP